MVLEFKTFIQIYDEGDLADEVCSSGLIKK